MSRRFDLIAFDWDGTLFDSTALIVRSIQGACADLGVPVPDEQRAAYVIGLGLHEALHALRQRQHVLAVATGKTRRGLDEALAHTELRGLFDASRTADETFSKPHPRMLEELMDEFGVPPERTLMVGNTTHDLQLALNAGAASVGVSFGAHDHASFAPLGPLFVAHSTAELHDWLLAHACAGCPRAAPVRQRRAG